MAVIRPENLPAAASVPTDAAIPIDTGSAVERATPSQIIDSAIPLASQAEAEAGVDNTKRVTPLRVKQAIDALGVGMGVLDDTVLPVFYSRQYVSLREAISAWMLAGGTLVINDDHTETLPFLVSDGTLLAGQSYRLTTDGPRTVTYNGPDHGYFWRFYIGDATPFRFDGILTIECDDKTGTGLWIDASGVTGADRRDCLIEGSLTVRNCYMKAGVSTIDGSALDFPGGNGIVAGGGFDTLRATGFFIENVGRADGAGTPGSNGCIGFSTNNAARRTEIGRWHVKNIYSDDTVPSDRGDMDGVLAFIAETNGDETAPHIFDGLAEECTVRAIKVYAPMGGGVTERIIVRRSVEPGFNGSIDIAHQHGSGTIRNCEFHYSGNANDGAGTTSIGMSLSPSTDLDVGPGIVSDIRIYDTTAVTRTAVIGCQGGGTKKRNYTICDVTDDGECEVLVYPGALGFNAGNDTTFLFDDIDVALTAGVFATDDSLYYLTAQYHRFRNRNADVPAVVNLDLVTEKNIRWGDHVGDDTCTGVHRYTGVYRGNPLFHNGLRGPGGGVEAAPLYGECEVAGRVTLPIVELATAQTWTGPAAGLFNNIGGDYTVRVQLLNNLQGYGVAETAQGATAFTSIKAPPAGLAFENGGAPTGAGTNVEVWKDASDQNVNVTNYNASTVRFQVIINP